MNYAWVETSVMVLIFVSALLFTLKHFAPNAYANGLRLFARKNKRGIDINLVIATSTSSCQTKCSACNGCSMAN